MSKMRLFPKGNRRTGRQDNRRGNAYRGFWAWVTYILAGTGLALEIVIALIVGGVGILVFKDEIVQWLVNRGYKCPKCGSVAWEA